VLRALGASDGYFCSPCLCFAALFDYTLAIYHESFLRGMEGMLGGISRTRIPPVLENEPDFYRMPQLPIPRYVAVQPLPQGPFRGQESLPPSAVGYPVLPR